MPDIMSNFTLSCWDCICYSKNDCNSLWLLVIAKGGYLITGGTITHARTPKDVKKTCLILIIETVRLATKGHSDWKLSHFEVIWLHFQTRRTAKAFTLQSTTDTSGPLYHEIFHFAFVVENRFTQETSIFPQDFFFFRVEGLKKEKVNLIWILCLWAELKWKYVLNRGDSHWDVSSSTQPQLTDLLKCPFNVTWLNVLNLDPLFYTQKTKKV